MGNKRDLVSWSSIVSCYADNHIRSKQSILRPKKKKRHLDSDVCVWWALIDMLAKCSADLISACKLFEKMPERSVGAWTLMMTRCTQLGCPKNAVDLFLDTLANGLCRIELHLQLFRRHVPDACVGCNLLDMHVKSVASGSLHDSRKVFDRMQDCKMMSWTSAFTFASLLSGVACISTIGKGEQINKLLFEFSMRREKNIITWTSMINGFAKHKFAMRAPVTFHKMLEAACRVHGNVELAKQEAAMIFKQEPDDLVDNVLLSNLYASAGLWEDAAPIRKRIKLKNLTKEDVHKFHTSHPEAREIYDERDQLASRIKKLGYVLNTEFVLHDVEEGQKEQYLLQHLEKIAVVFGLLSTSSLKPVWVFKNLSICRDCLHRIKCISMATGSSIVFHHFTDGTCSSNDYW
ncbi:hypothetical protein EUGRSUZ_K00350 [Eucalyptus grandis]|uniref:Uncharacterized protein n=2 Tax=Eucalyptus grandis TaxID=71139 RepID=A0ACC3ISS0_EUCGR|nr:hypothetical protein EUGRSUZ_K00350 [Eucalyptus grandis]